MAENYGSELDKIQNWQTFEKDANIDLEKMKTLNFFNSRSSLLYFLLFRNFY